MTQWRHPVCPVGPQTAASVNSQAIKTHISWRKVPFFTNKTHAMVPCFHYCLSDLSKKVYDLFQASGHITHNPPGHLANITLVTDVVLHETFIFIILTEKSLFTDVPASVQGHCFLRAGIIIYFFFFRAGCQWFDDTKKSFYLLCVVVAASMCETNISKADE